jgi:hypothetical protein
MKSSYCASDDSGRCQGLEIVRAPDGRLRQKLKCHKKALWKVGHLYLCYTCFEHYLETNTSVDLSSAVRLSDNERDFIEHNVARKNEPIRQYPQEPLCRQSLK